MVVRDVSLSVRRGEILTDARVLGSRLAELSVGRDARVVPLHLSDSAVLDVIRGFAILGIFFINLPAKVPFSVVS